MVPTLVISASPLTYNGTGQAVAVTALTVDGVTPVAGSFMALMDGSFHGVRRSMLAPTRRRRDVLQQRSQLRLDEHREHHDDSRGDLRPWGLGNGGQWEFTATASRNPSSASAVGIDGVTTVNGTFIYAYYNVVAAVEYPAFRTPKAAQRPDRRGISLRVHRVLHERRPELQ